jgi:hypothetical protein
LIYTATTNPPIAEYGQIDIMGDGFRDDSFFGDGIGGIM